MGGERHQRALATPGADQPRLVGRPREQPGRDRNRRRRHPLECKRGFAAASRSHVRALRASARSSTLRTRWVGVLGSSATNSTYRGTMNFGMQRHEEVENSSWRRTRRRAFGRRDLHLVLAGTRTAPRSQRTPARSGCSADERLRPRTTRCSRRRCGWRPSCGRRSSSCRPRRSGSRHPCGTSRCATPAPSPRACSKYPAFSTQGSSAADDQLADRAGRAPVRRARRRSAPRSRRTAAAARPQLGPFASDPSDTNGAPISVMP